MSEWVYEVFSKIPAQTYSGAGSQMKPNNIVHAQIYTMAKHKSKLRLNLLAVYLLNRMCVL